MLDPVGSKEVSVYPYESKIGKINASLGNADVVKEGNLSARMCEITPSFPRLSCNQTTELLIHKNAFLLFILFCCLTV